MILEFYTDLLPYLSPSPLRLCFLMHHGGCHQRWDVHKNHLGIGRLLLWLALLSRFCSLWSPRQLHSKMFSCRSSLVFLNPKLGLEVMVLEFTCGQAVYCVLPVRHVLLLPEHGAAQVLWSEVLCLWQWPHAGSDRVGLWPSPTVPFWGQWFCSCGGTASTQRQSNLIQTAVGIKVRWSRLIADAAQQCSGSSCWGPALQRGAHCISGDAGDVLARCLRVPST